MIKLSFEADYLNGTFLLLAFLFPQEIIPAPLEIFLIEPYVRHHWREEFYRNSLHSGEERNHCLCHYQSKINSGLNIVCPLSTLLSNAVNQPLSLCLFLFSILLWIFPLDLPSLL